MSDFLTVMGETQGLWPDACTTKCACGKLICYEAWFSWGRDECRTCFAAFKATLKQGDIETRPPTALGLSAPDETPTAKPAKRTGDYVCNRARETLGECQSAGHDSDFMTALGTIAFRDRAGQVVCYGCKLRDNKKAKEK